MSEVLRQPINALKLDSFNQDCLDLFKDLSIDSLLLRIAKIASTWNNGTYCICGLNSSKRGHFSNCKVHGFTPSEQKFIFRNEKDSVLSISAVESFITESADECQRYHLFKYHSPFINSILFVPIISEDDIIGSITVINKIGSSNFSKKDLDLTEALSIHAGIAINNARLYHRSAQREKDLAARNEHLSLLNELGHKYTRTNGDAQQLIEEMLPDIMHSLNPKACEFYLNGDQDPETFTLVASAGAPLKLFGNEPFTNTDGLAGQVIRTNETTALNNAALMEINAEIPANAFSHTILLPISTKDGVLGILVLAYKLVRGQTPPDQTLLNAIAAWIAPLIENLRSAHARQRVAILEERERIGMDLHDGVIQSIYGVGLILENARINAEKNPTMTAKTIGHAIEALNLTIRDIRSYIMNLKPAKLDHENFLQSIARLVNDFHANTFVTADFIPKVEHVEALTDDQINTFYMICKEALSNIAKHAHAHHVKVNFSESGDRFVLIIRDNGDGFDTAQHRDNTHHGVNNMRTRTQSLGGDMDITSIVGQGTTVIAWLPLLLQKDK